MDIYFFFNYFFMHPLLEKIFETRTFTNSKGEIIEIHSETSREQCLFLQEIIAGNGFKKSIEVGVAYGMSTLAITEAVANNGGRAFAMDKFQTEVWGGNGVDLVVQAGYAGQFEFEEAYSYRAMAILLEQGRKFDFAYIDTTKLFDWLSVDFSSWINCWT